MLSNLLIKIFVKDRENIKNIKVREDYGTLASLAGVFCNSFLMIVKLIIGIYMNSVAIIADAFNGLSDILVSVISLFGFKLGKKPADSKHPFGHGRYEYLSGILVSVIIIFLSFQFLISSISKIINPQPLDNTSIFLTLFLASTMLINIWIGNFNKKIGKKINSTSLIATGTENKQDALITLAIVSSIVIYSITGFERIDGIAGVLVSIILLRTGIKLAMETVSPLLGEVNEDLEQNIKEFISKYDEIHNVHELILHNYGPNNYMATVHVEMSEDISLNEIHDLIDKIEQDIKIEMFIHLVIHVDPVCVEKDKICK